MTKSFTFQPQPSDILIAVMGLTGSGKSTFIFHCTSHSVSTGASLHSDTQDISVYPCKTDIGDKFYLIDTPGFDDTELDDAQVLRKIATWVGDTYQQKIHLRGVLYLHRITDMRMQGAAIRNLFMFRELCGQNAIKNIILVTTMREDVKPEVGQQRENELRTTPQYWGDMIDKGGNMARHQNNHNSARSIIQNLLNNTKQTTLAIQREMVDEKKELKDTSAGRELDGILNQQRESFLRQIEDLKRDMTEARELQDRESQEQIRLLQEQRRVEIEKILRQQESMKIGLEQLHDERFAKLEQQLAAQQNQMEMDRKEIAGLRERQAGTSIDVNDPSSEANTMYTGSQTRAIREAGLKTSIKLEGHGRYRPGVAYAVFSPDACYIAVAAAVHTPYMGKPPIKVYNSVTGVAQSEFLHDRAVEHLSFSSDSRTLAVISFKYSNGQGSLPFRIIDFWDIRTGGYFWAIDYSAALNVKSTLSPDGRRVAIITRPRDDFQPYAGTDCVRVLESAAGSTVLELTVSSNPYSGGPHDVAFSPDGGRIAAMSDGFIDVWDSATGKHASKHNIPFASMFKYEIAFSHDGKGIVILSPEDKIIQFYDAAKGHCLWTQDAGEYDGYLTSSPGGRFAYISNTLHTGPCVVSIRDAMTGNLVKSYKTEIVYNIVVSPDFNNFKILH